MPSIVYPLKKTVTFCIIVVFKDPATATHPTPSVPNDEPGRAPRSTCSPGVTAEAAAKLHVQTTETEESTTDEADKQTSDEDVNMLNLQCYNIPH